MILWVKFMYHSNFVQLKMGKTEDFFWLNSNPYLIACVKVVYFFQSPEFFFLPIEPSTMLRMVFILLPLSPSTIMWDGTVIEVAVLPLFRFQSEIV